MGLVGTATVMTASGSQTTTSPTIAKPSGLQDGELLAAIVVIGSGNAFGTNTGWTLAWEESDGTALVRIGLFTKFVSNAAGEPSTYTFVAGTATRWGGVMSRVSNVTGLGTRVVENNAASTTADHPGVVTTTAGADVLHIVGYTTGSGVTGSVTPPSGFAEVGDSSSNSGSAVNKAVEVSVKTFASTGATGAANATIGESKANVVIMVELLAPASQVLTAAQRVTVSTRRAAIRAQQVAKARRVAIGVGSRLDTIFEAPNLQPLAAVATATIGGGSLVAGTKAITPSAAAATVSVPAGSFAKGAATLAPAAASCSASIGGGALSSGVQVLTPAAATATAAMGGGVLTFGVSLTPAAAAATASVPAGALVPFYVSTPAAAAAMATVPQGALVSGGVSFSPAPAVATASVPQGVLAIEAEVGTLLLRVTKLAGPRFRFNKKPR